MNCSIDESFFAARFGPLFRLNEQSGFKISEKEAQVVAQFVRYVYPEFKNNPLAAMQFSDFLSVVSSSSLSLSRWFESIVGIYAWLEQKRLRARFYDIFQYASCAQAIDNGQSIIFYLENYGFERSVKI